MSRAVMVVDDSGSFRTVLKQALNQAGYEVVEAVDGQDACAQLDGRVLGLVVCELALPHLDGIGLLQRLQSDSQHHSVPVILLATEDQQARKAEARAAGARAWITKPFPPSQLVAVVKRLCV